MRKLHGNPWAVLIVISLGFFMTLLDLTIINVAIPNMMLKLHAGLDDILWVINGYALVLATLVITAGRLGDLRGPRNMFIAGVLLFTVASAACGLAANPGELIAFRVAQGIGSAILMPQTLAILFRTMPPEKLGAAIGIWSAIAGVSTATGPALGGLLVTKFDWRWVFYINLPIGIVVIAATFLLIPNLKPGVRQRLDLPGVVLASLALFAICYGLVEGQKYNWGTITGFISIPLVIGAGIVLLAVFLLVQARTQDRAPLIPFSLFRQRNFSLMNGVSGGLGIGMIGLFLPFTIYLQSVLGFSALRTGLTFAPMSVVALFIGPYAGRLADKVGGKYLLFCGLTVFAAGFAWMTIAAKTTDTIFTFLPAVLVSGAGIGFVFAPMTMVAMQGVPPYLAGAASGTFNAIRQVGTVIGTAAIGALLQSRLAVELPAAAARSAGQTHASAAAKAELVARFKAAASGGLDPSPGVGARGSLGQVIFGDGFTHAMRPTLIMPIAVIGVAALCSLGARRKVLSGQAPRPSAPAGRPLEPGQAEIGS
jgi:EmrB/QacA subfamily drug resistance transporter